MRKKTINEWKENAKAAVSFDEKRKVYYDYLKTPEWHFISESVIKRDGHKCTICSSTDKLQSHHITYKHIFNELKHLEDLTTLCFDCHQNEHPDKARINELITGFDLRDDGIRRALKHANSKNPEWSESAFNFLKDYLKTHNEFMLEDVRMSSQNIIPEPPSKRAWGGNCSSWSQSRTHKKKRISKCNKSKSSCHSRNSVGSNVRSI